MVWKGRFLLDDVIGEGFREIEVGDKGFWCELGWGISWSVNIKERI